MLSCMFAWHCVTKANLHGTIVTKPLADVRPWASSWSHHYTAAQHLRADYSNITEQTRQQLRAAYNSSILMRHAVVLSQLG